MPLSHKTADTILAKVEDLKQINAKKPHAKIMNQKQEDSINIKCIVT
jgi:hypothetical protein